MRRFCLTLAVTLMAALALPDQGAAQQTNWWSWALPTTGETQFRTSTGAVIALDRDGEWERRRGADDRDRRDRGSDDGLGDIIFGDDDDRARRGGPPFCRNGQGHPVHGRRWCVDKGFGLGSRGSIGWDRSGWDDVIFRSPRRSGVYDRGGLIDVLGDVVFGRISAHGNRIGARGDLQGRLFQASSATVMQLRAGGVPVAELTDLDADGRVDVVLLAGSR
ncbi:MAG: hypothetical protein ACRELV_12910 [Longimicrobiales bacterium]